MQILRSTAHSYELITDWGIPPEKQSFKESAAIAVDAKDNVWVFNIPTNQLLIFDSDGNLLNIWPHKYENICLLYTSPSPRDGLLSRMPSSA